MQHDLSFLPYFITEDLFLLAEDRQAVRKAVAQETEKAPLKPADKATKQKEPQVPSATPAVPLTAKAEVKASAEAESPSKGKINPKLIFGENRKGLLILVEDKDHPVMERADGLFLKDVLKAIGYSFDDVAIVNICQCLSEADWEAVNNISFTHLFSFGVSRSEVPATITLAPYELESSKNRKFLMVDKLTVLRAERSRKIALWNLLKPMFV